MQIKINKEIRNYSENVFFGFNMTQIISIGVGIGIGAAVYGLLCLAPLTFNTKIAIAFIAAIPPAIFGFLRPQGLPLKTYLKRYLTWEFLSPHILPFKSVNKKLETWKQIRALSAELDASKNKTEKGGKPDESN